MRQPGALIGPHPRCRTCAHYSLPCRKFQRSTHQLIPKLPFSRLVREITARLIDESPRWQRRAVEALQEAAEAYLVRLLRLHQRGMCTDSGNSWDRQACSSSGIALGACRI